MSVNNIIEINNLTKYYGKSRGIIDVSFNVEEKEIFGFIGPNGAGKSTTIRTLMSLIYPTSGTASLFGKDCIKEGASLRQHIGYLPSEVFYYDKMKVKDLLAYSASFYQKDCTKKMNELADALNLDMNRKIEDLSYGNKKKVGIVQGLLHDPKLIILDEPTGGLDPLMQQRFFEILREENQKGATILFSSHILGEVQRLCGRVAIIKDGRIVKIETINTLTSNYKKLRLEFTTDTTINEFKHPTISDLKQIKSNEISFLYRGNVNELIEKISGYALKNLIIEDPDLEEVFLHYYQKGV